MGDIVSMENRVVHRRRVNLTKLALVAPDETAPVVALDYEENVGLYDESESAMINTIVNYCLHNHGEPCKDEVVSRMDGLRDVESIDGLEMYFYDTICFGFNNEDSLEYIEYSPLRTVENNIKVVLSVDDIVLIARNKFSKMASLKVLRAKGWEDYSRFEGEEDAVYCVTKGEDSVNITAYTDNSISLDFDELLLRDEQDEAINTGAFTGTGIEEILKRFGLPSFGLVYAENSLTFTYSFLDLGLCFSFECIDGKSILEGVSIVPRG